MSTALSPRACKLGVNLNCRRELHGDDSVPACDIAIGGIMLTQPELNALAGDDAHDSLFLSNNEPALPQMENMVLKGKRIGAKVVITTSTTMPAKFELSDCKLKDITLAPMSGGLTAMALKVQFSGDGVPLVVGNLSAYLGGDITFAVGETLLEVKTSKQAELPLNTFGEGETPQA